MKHFTYLFIFFLLLPVLAFSQSSSIWTQAPQGVTSIQALPDTKIDKFHTVKVDLDQINSILNQAPIEEFSNTNKNSKQTLVLPLPDGTLELFNIVESSVMEPELQVRFPEIRTYHVQGIDNPSTTGRISMTPKGFNAILLGVEGTVFIEPYSSQNKEVYITYWNNDFEQANPDFDFSCETSHKIMENSDLRATQTKAVPHGSELRTYRLAMAVDSSFYDLAGGNDADVLSEVVIIVNQVNSLYERDVAIRMVLINNTDDLFFTGSTSPYPYTSMNACALRGENQTIIDDIIGNDNYDIGHVLFTSFTSGCATLDAVCDNNRKAFGVTGWVNPFSDPFFTGVVCHEMGHQFNASHTWNGPNCAAGQHSPTTAYEPGTGSTIMGYPSVCGAADNVQSFFDYNFHLNSINRISDYSIGGDGNSCASVSATGNTIPTVNAGANFTIPLNTAFILTGSGADADGDALTYSWEQFDLGPQVTPNDPTTTGPIFRSFPPVMSPSRTFPQLSDILDNVSTKGEVLPTIGRDLNFRITVRDNRAGGGGVNSDAMLVTVDGGIGPFTVNTANTNTTICSGLRTISWSVNGSDALSANVNILLSYDGGFTFPVTLAANTPNDGSQQVDIPCNYSTQARIKIESVGNIFFDINNTNFTVGDNSNPSFTVPSDRTLSLDVNCFADTQPSNTGEPSNVNDDCDANPTVSYSDEVFAGSCSVEYAILRTWRVEDACGKFMESIQEIQVQDNTAPSFSVPTDTILFKDENCDYDASPAITGEPTDVMDNCDASPVSIYIDNIGVGSCIGEEIITRTWRVQDECGQFSQNVQIISIQDRMAPSFTVPDDTTVYKDENCEHDADPSLTGVPTEVSDNCDPDPAVDYDDVTLAGSCVGEEIITRTWTVTDDCGNSSEQQQVIMVLDTLAPIISNVSASPSTLWPPNHKMIDVEISYNAEDNCSEVSNSLSIVSNEPDNGTGDGNTTDDYEVIDENNVRLRAERNGPGEGRIYTITIRSEDDCGNVSTETVDVTVAHDRRGKSLVTTSIYPNSSDDYFTLEFEWNEDVKSDENVQVVVIDIVGRMLDQYEVLPGASINFGNRYTTGTYFVHLMQGNALLDTHQILKD